jgi:hypothetical protein
MAEAGVFADNSPVVLLITGHGLKTVEALAGTSPFATVIDGRLEEFDAYWRSREGSVPLRGQSVPVSAGGAREAAGT